jgi:hypothetical protein
MEQKLTKMATPESQCLDTSGAPDTSNKDVFNTLNARYSTDPVFHARIETELRRLWKLWTSKSVVS